MTEYNIVKAVEHIKNTYSGTWGTSGTVVTSSSINLPSWYDQYKNSFYAANSAYSIIPSSSPSILKIDPSVMDQVMKHIVTRYQPGEPLIVCVDNDFTTAQIRDLGTVLTDAGIEGVIISGARAGTGMTIHRDLKDKYQIIDVLARIGMVWQEHPDLNFTDLIAWYKGEYMGDDDFAAAIDVYVKKVYGQK